MKRNIKFIVILCLTTITVLNANKANAQDPAVIPNNYTTQMQPGEIQSHNFYVTNALVEKIESMNQDPGISIQSEIASDNRSFRITFGALVGYGTGRLCSFILKAVLKGVPGAGIIITVCEIAVAITIAHLLAAHIHAAPILHLPMIALVTSRSTISEEEESDSSIPTYRKTDTPTNLAIA
ncbi:hypothetical protein [uncultured Sanguibacteroides sp.]|uniref:hypothetical protein n=1 Tax=uncultured Sanguibacteroides sp. TaxID=1635151 RepID=UPI0025F4C109|nr:hypothetical protein [uncultured Sanguibacteroides sp.]